MKAHNKKRKPKHEVIANFNQYGNKLVYRNTKMINVIGIGNTHKKLYERLQKLTS